jgi:hypothetical protein
MHLGHTGPDEVHVALVCRVRDKQVGAAREIDKVRWILLFF